MHQEQYLPSLTLKWRIYLFQNTVFVAIT